MMTEGGEYVSSHYLDLRKIDNTMLKAEAVDAFIDKFLSSIEMKESIHFIEDKLSGFGGGKTSQQTLMKLGAFNGIVTWLVHDRSNRAAKITHIHPSTVKSIMRGDGLIIPKGGDKKGLTLAWVRAKEKTFPYVETKNGNPQAYCYDMSDSYIIVRAGYKRFVECNGNPSSEL